MAKKKNNKPSFFKKILWVFLFLIIIGIGLMGYEVYKTALAPNVSLRFQKTAYLYVPTNSNYEDVIRILNENHFLISMASFEWMAERLNYKNRIHPGRYEIHTGMNNKDLVLMLRSGRQKPVRITFNNMRTKQELASRISKELEADSISIISLLDNKDYLHKVGLNPKDALSLFLPDTYEFYWNTTAEHFLGKMSSVYNKFWSDKRKAKAAKDGFTPAEISILASIVEKETTKNDEKADIAGVYINRLKRNMKLDADPTLVYALGDFTIHRVLKAYMEIDSPYNTYKYAGLPPGPICMPSTSSIDAVLNYSHHDYMYFCASSDFSGHHCFAKTYEQHLVNARKFQHELGKRNIMN